MFCVIKSASCVLKNRTILNVWLAGEPHRQPVFELWACSATKGCMQQATRSAQSINLPMSNLWRSDRQGHSQRGTDRQPYIYRTTHTQTKACISLSWGRNAPQRGRCIENLWYSENCHSANALSAAGV